jgi:hypothetical protein
MPCIASHSHNQLDCATKIKFLDRFECPEFAQIRYKRAYNLEYYVRLKFPDVSHIFESLGYRPLLLSQNITNELMASFKELCAR